MTKTAEEGGGGGGGVDGGAGGEPRGRLHARAADRLARDSIGSARTEGTARGASSSGGGIARHLPASVYIERPGRTEHRGNGASARNHGGRGESTVASRANDAAKALGTFPETHASRTPSVLRHSPMT